MKLLNWAIAVVGKEIPCHTGSSTQLKQGCTVVLAVFVLNLLFNFNDWIDLKVVTNLRVTGPSRCPRAPAAVAVHGLSLASQLPHGPRGRAEGGHATHQQGLGTLWDLQWECVPCTGRAGVHTAAGPSPGSLHMYIFLLLLQELIHSKVV